MPRKPNPITVADIEAAERAQVVAAALRRQQPDPPPPPPNPDVEKVLRALDRVDRAPTGDEIASRMDADRRQEIYKRNVAEGYTEWAGLLDGGDR